VFQICRPGTGTPARGLPLRLSHTSSALPLSLIRRIELKNRNNIFITSRTCAIGRSSRLHLPSRPPQGKRFFFSTSFHVILARFSADACPLTEGLGSRKPLSYRPLAPLRESDVASLWAEFGPDRANYLMRVDLNMETGPYRPGCCCQHC